MRLITIRIHEQITIAQFRYIHGRYEKFTEQLDSLFSGNFIGGHLYSSLKVNLKMMDLRKYFKSES